MFCLVGKLAMKAEFLSDSHQCTRYSIVITEVWSGMEYIVGKWYNFVFYSELITYLDIELMTTTN